MAKWVLLALALSLSSAWGQTSRTIAMTGQGQEQAAPDQVTLEAGVTSQAATAAAALAANSRTMQAVFAALKKLGVADKDMQTANFSVQPQMNNANNNQARSITGYQVNNEVKVRLTDVSKLGAALDALVGAGANQMYGVNYGFQNSDALLAKARADAVADARTKAETFAKAAGVNLGPILSIEESGNPGPRPVFMAARVASVPVAAGEQSVNATVTIVWGIQ
jgi:uncharacterized protein